jgi:hypothetical protein
MDLYAYDLLAARLDRRGRAGTEKQPVVGGVFHDEDGLPQGFYVHQARVGEKVHVSAWYNEYGVLLDAEYTDKRGAVRPIINRTEWDVLQARSDFHAKIAGVI